jgi:hypothetical protein
MLLLLSAMTVLPAPAGDNPAPRRPEDQNADGRCPRTRYRSTVSPRDRRANTAPKPARAQPSCPFRDRSKMARRVCRRVPVADSGNHRISGEELLAALAACARPAHGLHSEVLRGERRRYPVTSSHAARSRKSWQRAAQAGQEPDRQPGATRPARHHGRPCRWRTCGPDPVSAAAVQVLGRLSRSRREAWPRSSRPCRGHYVRRCGRPYLRWCRGSCRG